MTIEASMGTWHVMYMTESLFYSNISYTANLYHF